MADELVVPSRPILTHVRLHRVAQDRAVHLLGADDGLLLADADQDDAGPAQVLLSEVGHSVSHPQDGPAQDHGRPLASCRSVNDSAPFNSR